MGWYSLSRITRHWLVLQLSQIMHSCHEIQSFGICQPLRPIFHFSVTTLLLLDRAEQKIRLHSHLFLNPFGYLAEVGNEIAPVVMTPLPPPALEESDLTGKHLISTLQGEGAQSSLKIPLSSSRCHLDQGRQEALPGLWTPTLVPGGNYLHLGPSASMEPFHCCLYMPKCSICLSNPIQWNHFLTFGKWVIV